MTGWAELERANALYTSDDLDGAAALCNARLGAVPEDGEALNLKGLIAFRQGRMEQAVSWLRQAARTANARPGFYNNLGEVLRQSGDAAEAETALREAVSRDPGYAVSLNNLGVVLTDRGKLAEARDVLERAVNADPDYADAHNNLGAVFLAEGDYQKAKACFEKALSLGPPKSDYAANLGLVLEEQGDEDGALDAYQQALSLDYASEKAFENLCGILFARDEAAAVRGLSMQLRAFGPELDYPYFFSGKAAVLMGEAEAAKVDLETYLQRDPADSHGAGLLLAASGKAPVPEKAGEAFLRRFYRGRAQSWDQFVAGQYHGHDIVLDRLKSSFGWPQPVGRLLDLGCGTGSLGALLRPDAAALDGVDISPDMVRRAEAKGIYDRLEQGDALAFLDAVEDPYDMIVAAAMLFHFRDLDGIFSSVARALTPGGGFVFTVFKGESDTPVLNAYNLYLHSRAYLDRTLTAAGFGGIEISDHIHEYERKTIPRYCYAVACRKA